jgi:hypothetical protein
MTISGISLILMALAVGYYIYCKAVGSSGRDRSRSSLSDEIDSGALLETRDYFAAAALSGMLAGNLHSDCGPGGYAADAYLYADAMLKARKGGEE